MKQSIYISSVVSLLLYAMLFYNCERDDICAEDTPTTPLLIIRFIDNNTRSEAKPVPNLSIRATDEGANPFLFLEQSPDSIAIPLKTDALLTDFELTINDGEEETNTDTIGFQYTTEEQYVSSACGFRVVFRGMTRSGPLADGDTWIKDIDIAQSDIIDETNTHVLIYH